MALYISSTGSGLMDGSSMDNAATLSNLNALINRAGAGGEIRILADTGPYYVTSPIMITTGGNAGAPVTVTGVDSFGNPMNVDIIGTRAPIYSPTAPSGQDVFRLLSGADHLQFQNMDFTNVGNGFRVGADISDLTIEHMTATNVQRFVEDYASGTNSSATIDGLTVRDVAVNGFSKGAIRLQYDTHNVVIEQVQGDSQQQDGDNFAIGVHLDGTAHDVLIRQTSMMNALDTTGAYYNGDGFATERGVYNVQFEQTYSAHNSDGGYDIKSSDTVLDQAVAEDNKRNFRVWSDSVTITNSTGIDPHSRGGEGATAQVWLNDGAAATISNSTFSDSSGASPVFDLSEGTSVVHLSPDEPRLSAMAGGSMFSATSMIELDATNTAVSSASHVLAANVDNLTLMGTAAVSGTGNGLANHIIGNTGNNILAGLGGADTLDGGAGIDTASYAASMTGVNVHLAVGFADGGDATGDVLVNIENLTGSALNDTLEGDSGYNVLDGGLGIDTLTYEHALAGVSLSLGITTTQNTGGAGTDIVKNFENLIGSTFNDSLTGNTAANMLTGLAGNDTISGGAGADTMIGGVGNDTYVVDNAADSVIENANEGTDTVKTNLSNYTLGENLENLVLTGSYGLQGTGNGANNAITGTVGNDTLDGGAGADTLTGGSGADRFVYNLQGLAAGDKIADFSHAQYDRIDVSQIDAIAGTSNSAFTFIGAANFSGVAGQLHYVVHPGGLTVEGDTDGNGVADFSIAVDGVTSLVAHDFIL